MWNLATSLMLWLSLGSSCGGVQFCYGSADFPCYPEHGPLSSGREETGHILLFYKVRVSSRLMYELCPFCGHQSVRPFLVRSGSCSLNWGQHIIVMISLLVTGLHLLLCFLPAWREKLKYMSHSPSLPPHPLSPTLFLSFLHMFILTVGEQLSESRWNIHDLSTSWSIFRMLWDTARCPVPVLANLGKLYITQDAEKPDLQ